MNIFLEDEKSLDGHKVRGIIAFDAVYKQFSDAAKIEEILSQAEKFIASQLPEDCHAVASDSKLTPRRGSNKRLDLQRMKFRSN